MITKEKHYRLVYANMVRHYLSGLGKDGDNVLAFMTNEQASGLLELARLAAWSTGLAYIPVHAEGHTSQTQSRGRNVGINTLIRELREYLNVREGEAIPEGCEFPKYWTYAEGEIVSPTLRKMEQARREGQLPMTGDDPMDSARAAGLEAVAAALGSGLPAGAPTPVTDDPGGFGDAPEVIPATMPPVDLDEAQEPFPRILRGPLPRQARGSSSS